MTTQLTIMSSRDRRRDALVADIADIDGDVNTGYNLPSGYPDCFVLGYEVRVLHIATMVATPELLGVRATITGADETNTQVVLATTRWSKFQVDALGTSYEFLEPRLWKRDEHLFLHFSEVDTNAVPTADLRVNVLVYRRTD